jgi:hypothetical protein
MPNNLFQEGKAGEYVRAAFRTQSMRKDDVEGHKTSWWVDKNI